MVQREVAERFAAAPRHGCLRCRLGEDRLLGIGADRRVRARVGVRTPPERRVGHRRDRPSRAPGDRPDTAVHVGPHSVQPAAQDVAPLAVGGRDPSAVRRRWYRADRPPGGARRHRVVRSGRGGRRVNVVLTARAKLTWSLRVVGVRNDGYHLIDAEMLTLDLADSLTVSAAAATRLTVSGPFGGGLSTDASNLVVRGARCRRAGGSGSSRQADSPWRRSRRRFGRRRGDPAVGWGGRSRRRRRARRRRAVLSRRRTGSGDGHRRGRRAPRPRRAHRDLGRAPAARQHAGRLSRPGTNSAARRRSVPTTWSRRRSPSSRDSLCGATGSPS